MTGAERNKGVFIMVVQFADQPVMRSARMRNNQMEGCDR